MTFSKIHEDERGEIYILEGLSSYPEATIFFTKAGYARGGCIHRKSVEFNVVIEGKIRYNVNGIMHRYSDGQTILIPPSSPHYFISETDSIVLEWGATIEEKKEKHEEFRGEVDSINKDRKNGEKRYYCF